MLETAGDGLSGRRDRGLLLLGFAGGLRRSELVALDVADVNFTAEGLIVNIRRGKTDQDAVGRPIGIPYGSNPATCPVRSLRAFLDAASIAEGALFRSVSRHGRLGGRLTSQSVALIVKKAARRAGLDPKGMAGHSLRSGFATSAAAGGATEHAIMTQTGHRSLTVLRRYIRRGTLWADNPATRLGL